MASTTGTPGTLRQLKIYHNIYRIAYDRLLFGVDLPPKIGCKYLAFWHWLECMGYYNFVNNSLHLPPWLFLELLRETETCIEFLNRESFSLVDERWLPLSCCVGGRTLTLGVVYENKFHAKRHIKDFKRNLSKRILDDISPRTSSAVSNGEIVQVQDNQQANHGSHGYLNVADNNTLFATFSKGHPITYQELEEFFTRKYGECIENIYISELFARVVVTSPEYVERILGVTDILQSNIQGKDVRIRRFIPRGPPPTPI
ncbi:uncharacterized protein LOC123226291 [Mangifera indica]|uniref:uncharacterized protein LOC123226291 n=1 Tax=Mangifera indica TaxID=29780 RepID=UPI001CF9A306|nr:uncharacterized protein LOC123226291 [Mangifera indica]